MQNLMTVVLATTKQKRRINMKVEQFGYKNQFVIFGEGKITFQSYRAKIAEVENGKVTLFKDWDYSNTTTRHLYRFLSEYTEFSNMNKKDVLAAIKDGRISYKED